MSKPLIVGYAPVEGSVGDSLGIAFVGTDSGRRLASYAGLPSDRHLLDHFDMVNLFRDPDAEWDRIVGARRARAIAEQLIAHRYRRVVLLSSPVAQAFGSSYHPLFTWEHRVLRDWQFDVAVCPHPSGLVRWWNDPENVAQANVFLSGLLRAK